MVFAVFLTAFFFGEKDSLRLACLLRYTQILPVIVNVFATGAAVSLAAVIIIFALTLVFGRVYCSSLCPFGTLQDIFIFLRGKTQKKRRFKYYRPLNWLRYPLPVAALIVSFIITGGLVIFSLFEPFGNFGRIAADVFKPGYAFFHNSAGQLLEKNGIFFLAKLEMHPMNPAVFYISVLLLVVIFLLSFFFSRFFCNTLCPSGAILSIIARVSFFKIRLKDECTKCGLCEAACKANCIDSKNRKIDFDRCIACFDCLGSCSQASIVYSAEKETIDSRGRRDFIKTAIGSAVVIAAAMPKKLFADFLEIKKKNPLVTPPGSVSLKHFNKYCEACHLCAANCPTKVIMPTWLEYGVTGILQPRLDYSKSYCLYECNTCSQVCPTGAIKPVKTGEKKLIQIGISHFIESNCIVASKGLECAVCNEYCPTKAVMLVPYKNRLKIPEIDEKICVGCGACENVCPAQPFKAIYVEGNAVHMKADKPEIKKLKPAAAGGKAFPF